MKQRIRIDQLRLGMRIESIDQPWIMTPFLRHRITITSHEQIERLRAFGVRTVEIARDSAGEEHASEGQRLQGGAADEPMTLESVADHQPALTSFEEELPVAKQVYNAAKTVIAEAMHDVRMGRAINIVEVNHAVARMAESVVRNPDALTSLSRLKKFDEYTFYHSVNTSVLALSLGRSLGMEQETLHRLGVGALLHDIGKTKVPLELLNKPGKYEPQEFEIIKQHALLGAELLSSTTGLTDDSIKPALEHHERVDGTGYPHRRSREELSRFGLIAAVVDIYDAITSDRCYHKAKPPHEALQFLYLVSRRGHLDHGIVQRFIQAVGVYPVGSLVILSTGEIGVVQRIHRERPLAPEVLVVKTSGGALLSKPETVDLGQAEGGSRRSIVGVADQQATGIDPTWYLDREVM